MKKILLQVFLFTLASTTAFVCTAIEIQPPPPEPLGCLARCLSKGLSPNTCAYICDI